MQIDLRYAALDETVEQRVRLAAETLAAYRIEARASDWDGTQCGVLVAGSDDAYGRRVIDIARRRGISVLAIGAAVDDADKTLAVSEATIVAIARGLRALLEARSSSDAPRRGDAVAPPRKDAEPAACALTRLAIYPTLAGVDLEASIHGTTVWLLPSAGRVLSATVADQLRARDRLGSDDWNFTPLRERTRLIGEISHSLDSFYLQGAWAARARLPAFTATGVRLRDWPDLGGASDIVDALRVVKALQRGNGNLGRIVAATDVAEADVSACLWAFRASGILQFDHGLQAPATRDARPRAQPGLLARLAAHFGLSRR